MNLHKSSPYSVGDLGERRAESVAFVSEVEISRLLCQNRYRREGIKWVTISNLLVYGRGGLCLN